MNTTLYWPFKHEWDTVGGAKYSGRFSAFLGAVTEYGFPFPMNVVLSGRDAQN